MWRLLQHKNCTHNNFSVANSNFIVAVLIDMILWSIYNGYVFITDCSMHYSMCSALQYTICIHIQYYTQTHMQYTSEHDLFFIPKFKIVLLWLLGSKQILCKWQNCHIIHISFKIYFIIYLNSFSLSKSILWHVSEHWSPPGNGTIEKRKPCLARQIV